MVRYGSPEYFDLMRADMADDAKGAALRQAFKGDAEMTNEMPNLLTPIFKNPVCRGSIALGTACGHCERCKWERKRHKDASKHQLVAAYVPIPPSADLVVKLASDVRWKELAEGSDFTIIDRQMLGDLYRAAIAAMGRK